MQRVKLTRTGKWVLYQLTSMKNIHLWSLFTEEERDSLIVLRLNRHVHWNDKTDHVPPRATTEFKEV